MTNITQEINKIAAEIKTATESIQSLFSAPSTTRLEKVNLGMKYYEISGLQYSFLRFYPFAEEDLLSPEALSLYTELSKAREAMSKITDKEEIPQELNDFLNNTNGKKN